MPFRAVGTFGPLASEALGEDYDAGLNALPGCGDFRTPPADKGMPGLRAGLNALPGCGDFRTASNARRLPRGTSVLMPFRAVGTFGLSGGDEMRIAGQESLNALPGCGDFRTDTRPPGLMEHHYRS